MDNASQNVVLFVYGSVLLMLLTFAFVALSVILKQRTRRYKTELQEADQKFEREILKIKLELQEEAFKILSTEVHDNIGQVLGGVSFMLQAESAKSVTERNNQVIEQSIDRIMHVIDDMRNLSHVLNGTRVEKLGLVNAIDKELSYFTLSKNLKTNFIYPPKELMPALSGSQTLLIFRIAQEAIHNTIRHARATRIEIRIVVEKSANLLILTIRDNGIGYKPALAGSGGLGLVSMQERAQLLGGILEIDAVPEDGCRVVLSLKTKS